MTEQTMVPELDANWRFLAAYADALQRDGTSAHEVERALRRRADALEVPVRIVAAPTLILLSIGPEQSPWTVLLPAELGQLDISRHERVERIADAVEARRMPAASGLAALQRPVVPLYDRATRALATIVLCGAAAPLFGGGVYAVLAAAIGGMALLLVLESPVLREIRVPLAALAGTAGSLSASQSSKGKSVIQTNRKTSSSIIPSCCPSSASRSRTCSTTRVWRTSIPSTTC